MKLARTQAIDRFNVRLLFVGSGDVVPFATLPRLLRAGDLVVLNDAATLPASLHGRTSRGEAFELRLSGPIAPHALRGVLLGDGDHRTRTEDRAAPPKLAVGDRIQLAGFPATVTASAGRMVELATRLPDDELWQRIYTAGAPVQYAHRPDLIPLYAVQTAYAARPWAVEMPSAGRPLTWDILLGLRANGIELATLTHAAGLSSTGDDELDRALPWPERYEIPRRTVDAIARAKARGGRVIAIGTTVVRALEAAALAAESPPCGASSDMPLLRPGSGVATLRIDPSYKPRVVDGLVSGLHVPGESHFELLSAFTPREVLERALGSAVAHDLSTHELGDTCLVIRGVANS
ncbi:S-adenosylmethionine:tRNA ribosyltransferase-isomerase [soil metagenome]